MSDEDRQRWNTRYREGRHPSDEPWDALVQLAEEGAAPLKFANGDE